MNVKKPVEKNHFIPCYWTAYWNTEYLISKRNNQKNKPARQTSIAYLNIRANKILNEKTEKVFVDKNRGITLLETKRDFDKIKNNFIIHNYEKNCNNQSDLLLLDFENHFTEYENISKPALIRTILTKKIKNIEDKTHLAQFVILQWIRNPIVLNNRLKFIQKNGNNKLDLLLEVRDCFVNRNKLENLIIPLVFCKWTIYQTKSNIFPIPDMPILENKNHIFVALAPDILLEIQLEKKTDEIASYKKKIPLLKFLKFKNILIKNVTNELVGNSDFLKYIKEKKKITFANNRYKLIVRLVQIEIKFFIFSFFPSRKKSFS